MKTPYTFTQFLDVFKDYNTAIWPIQILFYVLAIMVVFFLYRKPGTSDKIISIILSFFWLWIGLVYQLLFFTVINKAAYAFGVIFLVQGILFLIYGVFRPTLLFRNKNTFYNLTGILFIIYALVIYPILGYFLGHVYPYSPTFGLPCPTVIFTFGVLLFVDKKIPVFLLILPIFWSIVGFMAALNFGIYEDAGLLIAGISGTLLIMIKNGKY